jgi:hypothetical protein
MNRLFGFAVLIALLLFQFGPANAAENLKKLEIENKIAEYKAKGDYGKALELLGFYIDMKEKQKQPQDFLLAAALRERFRLRQLAHDPVIDLASLWKAISIDTEVFGRDHPVVAADYLAIADALLVSREKVQAEEYYIQGFTILFNIYGHEHPATQAAYQKLVAACGPILLSLR